MRKVIALGTAGLLAVGLFVYLTTTLFMWRIVFAGVLFLATFILVDGFFYYER